MCAHGVSGGDGVVSHGVLDYTYKCNNTRATTSGRRKVAPDDYSITQRDSRQHERLSHSAHGMIARKGCAPWVMAYAMDVMDAAGTAAAIGGRWNAIAVVLMQWCEQWV